ncbi:hypothetical protein [Pseudarthrobacter sp. NIBRBAC000502770]|uniref:hypothetical protein n=1 Tax=Pseudarthrobacter sp. NIBRBAC000502770 TaxID=2590785 RepID=UPI00114072B5|nr:hypothetical protein [Pseudarthrobacter sp. NIBRBAC000502770]QDG88140.1 hypothetical protein NIBR502770_06385 [Pseudarthrobacter sp. NIBRBAC000502770]
MKTTEFPPATPKGRAVRSTADLTCGDHIEAAYGGAIAHRGQVIRIAPGHELFWITDRPGGPQRLLDLTEFDITHL